MLSFYINKLHITPHYKEESKLNLLYYFQSVFEVHKKA
jgi:hypothetical protein